MLNENKIIDYFNDVKSFKINEEIIVNFVFFQWYKSQQAPFKLKSRYMLNKR